MIKSVSVNTKSFFLNALENLEVTSERKQRLVAISSYITEKISNGNSPNIMYICTHNNRRSQLAQVWSSFASGFYDLNAVSSFSGGTKVTCFFRNSIKTLQEVGFHVQILEFNHSNTKYLISQDHMTPLVAYSKLYDGNSKANPFIAIVTCSEAAELLPLIPDAEITFNLPFNDPQLFDGSTRVAEHYFNINKQIAGEIHFIFKEVKSSL